MSSVACGMKYSSKGNSVKNREVQGLLDSPEFKV